MDGSDASINEIRLRSESQGDTRDAQLKRPGFELTLLVESLLLSRQDGTNVNRSRLLNDSNSSCLKPLCCGRIGYTKNLNGQIRRNGSLQQKPSKSNRETTRDEVL